MSGHWKVHVDPKRVAKLITADGELLMMPAPRILVTDCHTEMVQEDDGEKVTVRVIDSFRLLGIDFVPAEKGVMRR